MPLAFLISVTIAIVGTYFSVNISEEEPRLIMRVITFICLSLSIIFSPLLFKILILLVIFI